MSVQRQSGEGEKRAVSSSAEARPSAEAIASDGATRSRIHRCSGQSVPSFAHAAVGGRPEVAARLLGAADALRRRGRVAIEPFNLDDHHALVARVLARLGEPAFAVAWAQGESLLLDQAIAEADGVLAAAASRVLDPL